MPYSVKRSNGSALIDLADRTINTTATDLNLVGRGAVNYGLPFTENFVRLLENFANRTPPTTPISGQLWYDTSMQLLKVFTGTQWKAVNEQGTTITAQDVRRMLVTVDGEGSGINADLLDGHHASYFVPASTFPDGFRIEDYAKRTGEVFTGDVQFTQVVRAEKTLVVGGAVMGWWTATNNPDVAEIVPGSNGGLFIDGPESNHVVLGISSNDGDDGFHILSRSVTGELANTQPYDLHLFQVTSNNLTYKNGKVWHQGNDGANSGLDADLLDGYHASDFVRKTEVSSGSYNLSLYAKVAGDTFTGDVSVGGAFRVGGARMATWNATSNADIDSLIVGSPSGFLLAGPESSHVVVAVSSNDYNDGFHVVARSATAPSTAGQPYDVHLFQATQNNLTYKGVKIWHEDNDGPSSGLNADLLDGYHASSFAQASAAAMLSGSSFTGNVAAPVFRVSGTETASAPGYSWTSNTNTGMFRPAANTLSLSTAGSERLRVADNGNIGIGTIAPDSALHLQRASAATIKVQNTTNAVSLILEASTSAGRIGTYTNNSLVLISNNTTALTISATQSATFAGSVAGASVTGSWIATQAEAEAGTVSNKIMTPQRSMQQIAKIVPGVGQSYSNLTSSRSLGVSYQNTTGRPIFVTFSVRNNGTSLYNAEVSSNGTTWIMVGKNLEGNHSFLVPTGHYYRTVRAQASSDTSAIDFWTELR